MRTWIALLVVLALIGAVLYIGLGPSDDAEDVRQDPPSEGNGVVEPNGENPPVLVAPPPERQPPVEEFAVREEVGVLLVAGAPHRFNIFMARGWDLHPKMRVVSWTAPPPSEPAGSGPPPAETLPAPLAQPPRASTFDAENIDVLVLHDIDPDLLDTDFWHEALKRVREKELGLLVMPGVLQGKAMVEHVALASVLPITEARTVSGQPPAGTFSGLAMFHVTEAGKRHPATRLVQWPAWSGRIWGAHDLLETPWGTGFCYPVVSTTEGAAVLLEAEPANADAWPAMIVGNPVGGRVLWFGGWDLGTRFAYGRPTVVQDWRTLVRNWAAWLAGLVEA